MPKTYYDVQINFTSNAQDMQGGLIGLQKQFFDMQKAIGKAWSEAIPSTSDIGKNLTNLARQLQGTAMGKEFQSAAKAVEGINKQLQIGATNVTAISPAKIISSWQSLSKVIDTLTAASARYAQEAKNATDPEKAKQYQALANAAKEYADALEPLNNQLAAQAKILSDLKSSMKEVGLQEREQSKAESDEEKQARLLQERMQGVWNIFTPFGQVMQGVLGATAAFSGSLTGMAMSIMFATSTSTAFVIAGMTIGGIFKIVTDVVNLAANVIKTALTVALQIGKAAFEGIRASIEAFIGAMDEVRTKILGTYEALGTFHGNLQLAPALWSAASDFASQYGFDVLDVSKAMDALNRSFLYNQQNMQVVAALAAKLGTTMDNAANIYSRAIGIDRAATDSLRSYGIEIGKVSDKMDRQSVIAYVNSAIMGQASDSLRAYSGSATASINKLESAFTSLLAAFGVPIWQALGPTIEMIAAGINKITAAIQTVDFSKLYMPLASFGTAMETLLNAVAPYIARIAEFLINNLGTALIYISRTIETSFESGKLQTFLDTIMHIGEILSTYVASAVTGTAVALSTVLSPAVDDLETKFGTLNNSAMPDFKSSCASVAGSVAYVATMFGGLGEMLDGVIKRLILVARLLAVPYSLYITTVFPLGGLALLQANLLSLPKAFKELGPSLSSIWKDYSGEAQKAADAARAAVNSVVASLESDNSAMRNTNRTSTNLFGTMTKLYKELNAVAGDTNSKIEYLPTAAGGASKAASEVQSLVDAWKGLISGQFQLTMPFDYQNWVDQMTTAYDKMGRNFGQETGFGRKDQWDEIYRRALDIVNLGEKSPWMNTDFLTPPPEVLAKGNDAVRAWAANLAHEFQLGMHPEMINWDALMEGLREQLTAKQNWANITQEAMKRANDLGLGVSSEMVQAALVGQMSPEAKGLAQNLQIADIISGSYKDQLSGTDFGGMAADAIGESMTANAEKIKTSTKTLFTLMSEAIQEGKSTFQDLFNSIFNIGPKPENTTGLTNEAPNFYELYNMPPSLTGGVTPGAGVNWPNYTLPPSIGPGQQTVPNVVNPLASGVQGVAENIKGQLPITIDQQFITFTPEALTSDASNYLNGFKSGVETKAPEMDWTTPLNSAFVASFSANAESIKNTGKSYASLLFDGIIDGMSDKVDSLAKAIAPIVEAAIKKYLSAKSATSTAAENIPGPSGIPAGVTP